jgi:hypothetical protein
MLYLLIILPCAYLLTGAALAMADALISCNGWDNRLVFTWPAFILSLFK